MGKIVSVKVPATSANLGPGFDTLGLALSIYDTLTFEKRSEGLVFSGCEEAYANEDNLAVVAYDAVLKKSGKTRTGLAVTIDAQIPVSRGLGSSAAVIVAGAFAANKIEECNFTREDLLEICNEIEGHPDNVAAAIYGGFTASVVQNGNPLVASYEVHSSLHFCALVPNEKLSTDKARSVLPKEVSLADAVTNLSSLAMLLKGMEQGEEQFLSAVTDTLHQPYRSSMITDFQQVEAMAKDLGACAFFISGAGSTCLSVAKEDISPALQEKVKSLSSEWQVLPLMVDHTGVTLWEE